MLERLKGDVAKFCADCPKIKNCPLASEERQSAADDFANSLVKIDRLALQDSSRCPRWIVPVSKKLKVA